MSAFGGSTVTVKAIHLASACYLKTRSKVQPVLVHVDGIDHGLTWTGPLHPAGKNKQLTHCNMNSYPTPPSQARDDADDDQLLLRHVREQKDVILHVKDERHSTFVTPDNGNTKLSAGNVCLRDMTHLHGGIDCSFLQSMVWSALSDVSLSQGHWSQSCSACSSQS